METLITNFLAIWSHWVWPILLFVIGLGLVVFVHELGHFLAARAAKIKVERFAFGFGPRLFGFTRGETDYCINLLPFGGYVKMLGQEDVKEADQTSDPRSFNNKPIRARFAVISAGVFMNFVLAAVLFVLVAMVGKDYLAPVIGAVRPGFPAASAQIEWMAPPVEEGRGTTQPATQPCQTQGLLPGDRILNIEDHGFLLNYVSKPVTRFSDVTLVSTLADPDSSYLFTIQREVGGRKCIGKTRMGVKRLADDSQYAFGVAAASNTTFSRYTDLITASPFLDGDKLVSINGQAVAHSWQISGIEDRLTGAPVTVTVLRGGHELNITVLPRLYLRDDVLYLTDGTRLHCWPTGKDDGTMQCVTGDGKTITVDQSKIAGGAVRERLDILGLIPRIKVVAISKGSPADKAKIKVGDIVTGYGDRAAPSYWEFLETNRQHAGTGTNIVVLRDGAAKSLWVVPVEHDDVTLVGIADEPDPEHAVVAAVREGSPAAAAGIEPEAVIVAINDQPVDNWVQIYQQLKEDLGQDVRITYRLGARHQTAEIGRLDTSDFDPNDYRFDVFGREIAFRPLEVSLVYRNPLRALYWGARETCKLIVSTYVSLGRLSQGTVSAKALSGPVGIGAIALEAGRRSLVDLVYFMAFLSASLAVINFLPIPVTDGGHAVFLIIEKVRGKPLPGRLIYALQVAGLILIVGVFVALTWQDIARLLANRW